PVRTHGAPRSLERLVHDASVRLGVGRRCDADTHSHDVLSCWLGGVPEAAPSAEYLLVPYATTSGDCRLVLVHGPNRITDAPIRQIRSSATSRRSGFVPPIAQRQSKEAEIWTPP